MIHIRLATENDLAVISDIFQYARSFMAANGNPNQWINGYPSEDLMREQIRNGWCYICEEKDRPVATFCFIPGPDPCYQHIEGHWLSDTPYYVLHRIASDGSCKGIGKHCIRWCLSRCASLRVDTHQDNKIMQHMLQDLGFTYCGVIYVANGTPRWAYQLDQ